MKSQHMQEYANRRIARLRAWAFYTAVGFCVFGVVRACIDIIRLHARLPAGQIVGQCLGDLTWVCSGVVIMVLLRWLDTGQEDQEPDDRPGK